MVRETNSEIPEIPDSAPEGYISLAELNEILDKRDKAHAEQLAVIAARLPVAQVAANAGGPGYDNHQPSWSLAEQEAAARGETLEHWT
jgi:hypothetical protein